MALMGQQAYSYMSRIQILQRNSLSSAGTVLRKWVELGASHTFLCYNY